MFIKKILLALALIGYMSAIQPSQAGENDLKFPMEASWGGKKINAGIGELGLPENATGKSPVIILVHGTKGIGYREETWASYLQAQGYATFTLDYFWPRDVDGSGRNIPRDPKDVWGAIKLLAKHPKIDISKLAVMGFSNGGSVTRSAAELNIKTDTNGVLPKAYIMVYGGCHSEVYLGDTSYQPALLYIAGSKDQLVTADTCLMRKDDSYAEDIEVFVIEGAYHMFDGNKSVTFTHRRWGKVTVEENSEATEKAHEKVKSFLAQKLAK